MKPLSKIWVKFANRDLRDKEDFETNSRNNKMAKISSKSRKIKKVERIIKEYIKGLRPQIRVEKVILFGSHARGEAGKYSDIDLIIISPDFKGMDFMERLIWLSQMRKEKFMSPGMDIFGYTKEEFERLSSESIVLEEAKRKGVVMMER